MPLHMPTISIHALREEGDSTVSGARSGSSGYFYPRPPRGGRRSDSTLSASASAISIHALREEGDRSRCITLCYVEDFYPRPPRGGRPTAGTAALSQLAISIHALREEGDSKMIFCGTSPEISIHALREEGDVRAAPREPAIQAISIHALREEGDPTRLSAKAGAHYFYPRPPRGGRRWNPVPASHGRR